ncbi:MFS transporter [Ramlibacter solisilvae]|uniref:Major facilitator superfamily (MFS) profile domain-containing protein n=1 Tax=Ramlibacter tataouinensis TaxID=94132 RepID=A0A127JW01_9BURK|nr:MFS transporter [Ramlibacter tataouinensis]AMO24059.1 hypothetical protein UC35_15890 [Ramlibacter tataouinensis]
MTLATSPTADVSVPTHALDGLYRRIAWRLLPLLFLCYVVNLIDRGNVGFAQLQMKDALGFSDAVYGLGAGILFVGYLLFELPSNILLKRWGARATLLRIMVLWGLVSVATMFVRTPEQFYVVRFMLGVFEAGFFPGVVYYLTFWFPQQRRARVVALFMMGAVASGLVSNPLSGWILSAMDGLGGWGGWQWMFLVEGLPAVLLGFLVYFTLPNTPADAQWLNADDRHLLNADLRAQTQAEAAPTGQVLRRMIASPVVWLLCLVGFCITFSAYFIGFWTPTLIRGLGVTDLRLVGLYAAVPSVFGAAAMYLWGRRSDTKNERQWHCMSAILVGAVGLLAIIWTSPRLEWTMAALTIAGAGLIAALPVYWALVTSRLEPMAAAVGIAFINSMANLSGAISPALTGAIKARTGSFDGGIVICVALLVLGALVVGLMAKPAASKT